jgi:hypothetical protein
MYRPELAGAILLAVTTISANAQTFHADLSGFDELSPGAVFTPGQGTLTLKLDQKLQLVTYTLTYSGLTATVVGSAYGRASLEDMAAALRTFPLAGACPQMSSNTGSLIPARRPTALKVCRHA